MSTRDSAYCYETGPYFPPEQYQPPIRIDLRVTQLWVKVAYHNSTQIHHLAPYTTCSKAHSFYRPPHPITSCCSDRSLDWFTQTGSELARIKAIFVLLTLVSRAYMHCAATSIRCINYNVFNFCFIYTNHLLCSSSTLLPRVHHGYCTIL